MKSSKECDAMDCASFATIYHGVALGSLLQRIKLGITQRFPESIFLRTTIYQVFFLKSKIKYFKKHHRVNVFANVAFDITLF